MKKDCKGIYFLYFKNTIVYIGMSTGSIKKRLLEHSCNRQKIFDEFKIINLENYNDYQISNFEKKLIRDLSPFFNMTYKYKSHVKNKSTIILEDIKRKESLEVSKKWQS